MTGRTSLDGYRQQRIAVLLLSALWLSGCATHATKASQDARPAEAYTRLGEAYLARGNLPRASQALNHALELAPDDAAARQAMAIVHQRQGDDRLAEVAFRAALDEAPDLTRARNNYAAFLYDQGRLEAACHQLQRASTDSHYANRAQLLVNLGRCQAATGNTAAARVSFKDALRIKPELSGGHWRLAALEVTLGRLDSAEQHLEHYRRLVGPGNSPDSVTVRLADDIARARGKNSQIAASPGTP